MWYMLHTCNREKALTMYVRCDICMLHTCNREKAINHVRETFLECWKLRSTEPCFYSLENLVLLRVSSVSKQGNENVSSDLLSREGDRHLISPACVGDNIYTRSAREKRNWWRMSRHPVAAQFEWWIRLLAVSLVNCHSCFLSVGVRHWKCRWKDHFWSWWLRRFCFVFVFQTKSLRSSSHLNSRLGL